MSQATHRVEDRKEPVASPATAPSSRARAASELGRPRDAAEGGSSSGLALTEPGRVSKRRRLDFESMSDDEPEEGKGDRKDEMVIDTNSSISNISRIFETLQDEIKNIAGARGAALEESLASFRDMRRRRERKEKLDPELSDLVPSKWGARSTVQREEDQFWIKERKKRTPWFRSSLPAPAQLKDEMVASLMDKADVQYVSNELPVLMRKNCDVIRWSNAAYKEFRRLADRYDISKTDRTRMYTALEQVPRQTVIRNEELMDAALKKVYKKMPKSLWESPEDQKDQKRVSPLLDDEQLKVWREMAATKKGVRELVQPIVVTGLDSIRPNVVVRFQL